MSKLTDIKFKIDQLDGGAFQNLCDAYLYCRGYGTGYSLGMYTGTDKTAKGNPDTYFCTANNKYVFVMYTTQKTNFLKKAIEDIQKCFDQSGTGIASEDIEEIVYCHTYGRMEPGDQKKLQELCEEQNISLTLIGLDDLGNDLYLKYPQLARDHLGISIGTGQVSTMKEFVLSHDRKKAVAPLGTNFLFREKELEAAKSKLEQSDVLVIAGTAGVGKTRLALKVCEALTVEKGYEIICIRSNSLELYEDLTVALEPEKDYLVLIDDANELTGIHFVLDFLGQAGSGQRRINKIIMTVRDYARKSVVDKVLEYESPQFLKVGILKDEDIDTLMESVFGITNPAYLEKIVAIAEGNARLAMLAGKIAAESGSLSSIRDVSELYSHYYGEQINTIISSNTGIASAGIISFFQALRLDYLEKLDDIFSVMGITKEEFISDIKQLHDLELVDLCHDVAVKVSDQSLSNYLIKYVFYDKKLINLSQMVRLSFSINRARTISACDILLSIFSDEKVFIYVKQQIGVIWDELKTDYSSFMPFFKAFHMLRPTETLSWIYEYVDQMPHHQYNVKEILFKKTDGEKAIDDDIVNILCSFANHSQLPEAIDLLLFYYQKRPGLFEEIYSAFVSRLGVDRESYRYDYFTQRIVVEHLITMVKDNPNQNNVLLFVRVAEQYLHLSFSRAEGGRHRNTIRYYTMPLKANDTVRKYRRELLDLLLEIYKNGKCRAEIEGFLIDYCSGNGNDVDYSIVGQELDCIIRFVTLLSTEKLYHCMIAKHISDIARRAEYDCEKSVSPFLKSRKFIIYQSLKPEWEEMLHDNRSRFKNRVEQFVQDYDLSDIRYLLDVCKECQATTDGRDEKLTTGLMHVLDILSSKQELCADVVKAYLDADTPYNVCADGILRNLFAKMKVENVRELINSFDYHQKNAWLWSFFVELPQEEVSKKWADELLLFLRMPTDALRGMRYRPLDQLRKYECVDKEIILKASKIIIGQFENNPSVAHLYFFYMLHPSNGEEVDTLCMFEHNTALLEEIYIKSVEYSNNMDLDGILLSGIIKKDVEFLFCYLEKCLENVPRYYSDHCTWLGRLAFVWKEKSLSYMDEINEFFFKKTEKGRWPYSFALGYLLLHKKSEIYVAEQQQCWLYHTIDQYYKDTSRMSALFSAIEEHSIERRKMTLLYFLERNSDYALFKALPLEASCYGGIGSQIPYMQERIEYLRSLLPMLTGIKFLKHREKVENDIEQWKARIQQEEIQELLSDL